MIVPLKTHGAVPYLKGPPSGAASVRIQCGQFPGGRPSSSLSSRPSTQIGPVTCPR